MAHKPYHLHKRPTLKKGTVTLQKNITFGGQYAQGWWIWDRCDYVKSQIARGANLSRDYCDSMRTYLDNHILPTFENVRMWKINSGMIGN